MLNSQVIRANHCIPTVTTTLVHLKLYKAQRESISTVNCTA